MKLIISSSELQAFMGARAYNPDYAKRLRKEIWAGVRGRLNIPRSTKLKVELDDRADPDYLVLKDKHTGATLFGDSNGRYSHAEMVVSTAANGNVTTATSAGVTPSDATVQAGTIEAAVVNAGPFVDVAIRSGGEDRVVQTVSNAGLVRYVAVPVSGMAALADVRVALSGAGCDIIVRADAGRVAYDADEDTVLVRLDAGNADDDGATQV